MTGRPESDTRSSTQDESLEPTVVPDGNVRYDFCGQAGGWTPEPCHVHLPRRVLEALEID